MLAYFKTGFHRKIGLWRLSLGVLNMDDDAQNKRQVKIYLLIIPIISGLFHIVRLGKGVPI